jgi:predicted transcriptional regulator
MIARDLIKDDVPPIKPFESMEKALEWMDEFRVSHLPVVDGSKYYGLVSENMIYDCNEASLPVSELNLTMNRPFVFEDVHVYKVMQMVAELKLSVVPILNKKEKYIGLSTMKQLMDYLTNTSSISEAGSVIVLEINQFDYSLAHISQIVESNDAKVLTSFITSSLDSKMMDVTIKINRTNIEAVLQTFYRYDYKVKASFSEDEFEQDMKKRYQGLMKYLNM